MMSRVATIVIAAWCAFLIVAGTTWRLIDGAPFFYELAAGVIVTAVGLVLIARVPGNRVSSLIMLAGVVWAWMYLGNSLTTAQWRALVPEVVVISFTWVGNWLWFVGFIALVFAMLRFPNGLLLSPRWRWAWWTGMVGSGLVILGAMFGPFQTDARFIDAKHRLPVVRANLTISNPLEVRDADLLLLVGALPVLVFGVATLVSLIVRYRRSGNLERTQIRWVAFATGLAMATYLLGNAIIDYTPIDSWDPLTLVIIVAVPVSIGIAVTRYRLYEIDRIVSRTVAYAIVAVALTGVFAVGTIWVPQQLPTDNSNLAVAASTLVVAALFNPLRHRVQRIVDRRFNRLPYESDAVNEALSRRLRTAVEPEAVGAGLAGTVGSVMQPTTLGVWIRER